MIRQFNIQNTISSNGITVRRPIAAQAANHNSKRNRGFRKNELPLDKVLDKIFSLPSRHFEKVPLAVVGIVPKPPKEMTVEILLETTASWNGTDYGTHLQCRPKITIKKIVIPPNYHLQEHEHRELVTGRVMTGSITVEDTESLQYQTFMKDDWIPETVATKHQAFTGNATVVLEVVFIEFRQRTIGFLKLLKSAMQWLIDSFSALRLH